MKRLIVTLLLPLVLCGCNSARQQNRNTGPTTHPVPDRPDEAERGPIKLYGLDVIDQLHAFAYGELEDSTGSVVLRTIDGGASWSAVLRVPGGSIEGMDFVGAAKGVLVTEYGGTLHTEDGGQTWKAMEGAGHFKRRVPAGSNPEQSPGLFASHAVDEKTGWVGGFEQDATDKRIERPVIFRTADGGASWNRVNMDGLPAAEITGFASIGSEGYAAAGSFEDEQLGVVLKTTDSGESWTAIATGLQQIVTAVAVPSPGRIVLVGKRIPRGSEGPGEIVLSQDGGATWAAVQSAGVPLAEVKFADAQTGWAVGGHKIFKTVDGGATWTLQAFDLATTTEIKEPSDEKSIDDFEPLFESFTLTGPDRGYAATDEGVYTYSR